MDLDDTASLDHQSFDSTFNSVPFTSTPLKEGRHTSLAEISDTSVVAPSFSSLEESSATSLEPQISSLSDNSPEINKTPPTIQSPISCYGMKLVGDNLNVTVTPRDMRSDRQKCQLDYFQMYAVKDRIDFSEFSEEPPSVSPHPPLHELLPTGEDDKVMLSNFGILITRMLVKHIPFFSAVFSDVVVEHIPHMYSKEMSTKSEIVSFVHALKSLD